MEAWWAIKFKDDSIGFMHLVDGYCQNVYRANGTPVGPLEKVEYTCTDTNATKPHWYVAS